MSLHLPARRVATTACTAAGRPSLHFQYLQPRIQRRNAGWFNWGSRSELPPEKSPFTKELTRREREMMLARRNLERTQGQSIFDDEIAEQERKQKEENEAAMSGETKAGGSRVKEHMERALNPDPRWRVRFLRKKIMQMVRDRTEGKPLTRDQLARLSEKAHTSSSPPLPTSTKKLVHLSHQIAGKTVDNAIIQMRFSKKKMAREVLWQLEEARDNAIVAHGMGLGSAAKGNGDGDKASEKQIRKIQTKDGNWIQVEDPTTLYVDQSWVTKGPWRGARIRYHGRGHRSAMRRPTASISVVLKEEKTRIRQHDQRVEKQAKKAPWVHLPNRPVTAQRPYYTW